MLSWNWDRFWKSIISLTRGADQKSYSNSNQLKTRYVEECIDRGFKSLSRGSSNFNDKDIDDAIEAFSAVIEMIPNSPRYYKERAQAWKERGNFEKAIEDYSTLISMFPNDKDYYRLRASALVSKRRFRQSNRRLLNTHKK